MNRDSLSEHSDRDDLLQLVAVALRDLSVAATLLEQAEAVGASDVEQYRKALIANADKAEDVLERVVAEFGDIQRPEGWVADIWSMGRWQR